MQCGNGFQSTTNCHQEVEFGHIYTCTCWTCIDLGLLSRQMSMGRIGRNSLGMFKTQCKTTEIFQVIGKSSGLGWVTTRMLLHVYCKPVE